MLPVRSFLIPGQGFLLPARLHCRTWRVLQGFYFPVELPIPGFPESLSVCLLQYWKVGFASDGFAPTHFPEQQVVAQD